MRFTASKTTALVFLTLFSSTLAFSAGKKGHAAGGKAAKECTDKGGTWDKKHKKCEPAKNAESSPTPTETAPSSEPAPAGEAAPTNP